VICRLFYCTDNLHFLARYFVDHWDFQVVFNGTFSVDTFFYMSGLLVVFLGLVELSKSDGSMMNVLLKYLYRYLRYACFFHGYFALCLLVVLLCLHDTCKVRKQTEIILATQLDWPL